ncbi:hypothetical protein [Pikeienuella sp. HZG-20]|uniref:hypothetical protein n=1 Tax=Paludibacillus litoralis TaxID=3133267 RepID=UPI0030EBED7C
MIDTVFVHTNAQQMVGAIVARHSLKRQASDPASFDVRILQREDFQIFETFEGRKFLRAGGWRVWRNDDLQSFTPLRFAPPEVMDYQGRAIVIDPDVFAVGDICELLKRDMGGCGVLARPRPGHNGREDYMATSVMLMDCAKLRHWRMQDQFEAMFRGELDYEDWIILANQPAGTVGPLEEYWNQFDRLTPETRLLHNTKRRTQPWKTGLPIDFTNRVPLVGKFLPNAGIRLPGKYKQHPDMRQENLFFAYLSECLDAGALTEADVRREMAANHVRHDALERVKAAPSVDAVLSAAAA